MANDTPAPVIVWFRRDLRIADNSALTEAAESGAPVIPLYIHDEQLDGRPLGAASRWWLDKSLRALAADLKDRGAPLVLRSGDAESVLRSVIEETGAQTVYMNRLFEPAAWERDAEIAQGLKADGVTCRGFNGTMLARPGSVRTGQDAPYKVFTPFLKALLQVVEEPAPRDGPRTLDGIEGLKTEPVDDWSLHPTRPDWSEDFDWTPGEAARARPCPAFWPARSRPTATVATFRGRTGPAACPLTCISARSAHGGPCTPRVRRPRTAGFRPNRPRNSSAKSAGASSQLIFCTSSPTWPSAPSGPSSTPWSGATTPRVWRPGSAA
ncbi:MULTISPECIES: deoxyribodipyrimidine photo-lyase [Brevundimonas]|uniref:deoxyribodipyrimidine photo-lyase n=1 Tax=Brevundimonas TaxID=41275 RepID=UPI0003FCD729|nr:MULTISPECIES: deoxyribodipyrimidine photo-lyase [Brevundimonas]